MRKNMHSPPVDAERLLAAYAHTRDPETLDQIVGGHLYIAAIIARRFSGRGVEYDDLYQVASLALVKAVGRFEPQRGIKFASFATPAMVGEVKNYFRDRLRAIRLPRRGAKLMADIEGARERLLQNLRRQPTLAEIAKDLNAPLDEVIEALEMRGAANPMSLDAMPEDDEESSPLIAFLGIDDERYGEFEMGDMFTRAMDALTEREREVIRLRYYEGKTQRDVAEQINMSQMSVSRAERRALEQLRASIESGEDT